MRKRCALMKRFHAISCVSYGLAFLPVCSAALAGTVDDLPPAAIVHQLVADGHEIRGIKCKPAVCKADIRDSFGIVNQHAVNAKTGQITRNSILSRFVQVPAPREITGVAAMLAVAYAGHYDLISMDYRGGMYDIRAKDDAGDIGRFKVNAVTKAVVEIEN